MADQYPLYVISAIGWPPFPRRRPSTISFIAEIFLLGAPFRRRSGDGPVSVTGVAVTVAVVLPLPRRRRLASVDAARVELGESTTPLCTTPTTRSKTRCATRLVWLLLARSNPPRRPKVPLFWVDRDIGAKQADDATRPEEGCSEARRDSTRRNTFSAPRPCFCANTWRAKCAQNHGRGRPVAGGGFAGESPLPKGTRNEEGSKFGRGRNLVNSFY